MASKQRHTAAAHGERERLSAVDTAWLRMDVPGNPMTIVSVLTTATPVRASLLRRRIGSRLARFPRVTPKAKRKTGAFVYTNRFPLEIVEIFERHGFIWGGKWYHFDTFHFEYRPELITLAKQCWPTR